ncbi:MULTISPECIES: DUF262 domain-containing protein [Pseudomonas]|uniref:GmrSD restriction endonucleases N-terminal domain-containing protein n=2 Tax=Pseudomonas TaxID=286 RepID=A0A0W0HAN9_PSEFL|nr:MULTISPECIES: DUF262 domain-containing protein [Pseudomonas]KTB57908.1 hypothetical protein AO063_20765 [Pseudomonas fluorescens ICMP 11288]RMQ92450.1 hypothetical protein ALP97_200090 [Pseudomonas salomonii]
MTTQGFGAQLLTLPTIFSDRLFTIPDYQRGYAWEKKQVDELLKDLDHLMQDGTTLRHYTGTLVLSRPATSLNGEFHVVDGQQRMTTLVIFLYLLRDHLPELCHPAFTELYLRRGNIGNERAVLRLNSDTRSFFERAITDQGGLDSNPVKLEAHQRLLIAKNTISKWLDDKMANGISSEYIKSIVENKLGFLVFAPVEDAETGIMFEVINNRGKPLSELEKVKNYLIYCCVKLSASSLREVIDQDWSEILAALNVANKTSVGDESAFLRYCLVVHFKLNKTDSQHGYEELKKRVNLDGYLTNDISRELVVKKISAFVSFMKTSSVWYQRLYGRDHRGLQTEVVVLLDQIRAQARHASIMPLFLALVIKLKGAGENLQKLLRLLEILNFRVYMARNMTSRNDTGQGDLYWYAAQYYHSGLLGYYSPEQLKVGRKQLETEEEVLEYKLVKFIDWLAADLPFIKSFSLEVDSPDDFYKWRGLRYFLMNYEARLQPRKTIHIDRILLGVSEGKTADYYSVEHLWAIENRNGAGENTRKQDKYQKRRLGNFVLLELRLNIQGHRDDVEIKIPRYCVGLEDEPPTELHQVRKMAVNAKELISEYQSKRRTVNYFHDFHGELNDRQEQRFIKFAQLRWSLKGFIGYAQIRREAGGDVVQD